MRLDCVLHRIGSHKRSGKKLAEQILGGLIAATICATFRDWGTGQQHTRIEVSSRLLSKVHRQAHHPLHLPQGIPMLAISQNVSQHGRGAPCTFLSLPLSNCEKSIEGFKFKRNGKGIKAPIRKLKMDSILGGKPWLDETSTSLRSLIGKLARECKGSATISHAGSEWINRLPMANLFLEG